MYIDSSSTKPSPEKMFRPWQIGLRGYMGEYCSARLWQLKPEASAADLEDLAATGIAEMHRWIPGIEQLSLVHVEDGSHGSQPCYLMLITFANYEAYRTWRRIEEEGPDYWERYASVSMHWEQIARLVEEYRGDLTDLMPRQDSRE